MSNKKHDPPPLEPSPGDAAHTLARTGLSAIPLVGTAAIELLNAVLSPPLIRRQQQWREEIADAIRSLEDSGVKPEDLASNDAFVDAVLTASDMAMRTSQKEKLEALRAAIENSALPDAPERSLQHFFLNLVDEFTEWHIRILFLFNGPRQWFAENGRSLQERSMMSSLSDILTQAFPELRPHRQFYDQVWRDLYSRGLVGTDGLHTSMTPEGALASRTTDLGQRFLKFVRPAE